MSWIWPNNSWDWAEATQASLIGFDTINILFIIYVKFSTIINLYTVIGIKMLIIVYNNYMQ